MKVRSNLHLPLKAVSLSGLVVCAAAGMIWFVLAALPLAWGTASGSARAVATVELYHWTDFRFDAPGAAAGLARWDVERPVQLDT